MSKVLITGVAGFMGSHMADDFLAKGYEVVGIDNLVGGYKDNIPNDVEFYNLDCSVFDDIESVFRNADLVVHTACTAYEGLSVFSPSLIVRNTSLATAATLSASVRHGVSKYVFLSSMARYGTQDTVPFTEDMQTKPQDPYGISKVESEMLIRNVSETHGMDYSILVPHNIIGPRQKYDDPFRNVASIMINRMLQGQQPIIYGDGSQQRCFSFYQDVANPIMVASENDIANGRVINIGPDEEFISINNLAFIIADILNFDLDPIYTPGRPQEVKDATCSANLARELLGYQTTTSLRDGLTQLAEWIQERGTKPFEYHLPLEFITEKTPRTWTEKLF
jgi:UDP-glucose 4-epimerase